MAVVYRKARGKLKSLLQAVLYAGGYQLQGIRYCPRQLLDPACLRVLEFDDVICRQMFEIGPEFTFVQVGAFDGITGDPLRKYICNCRWRGILIEPQATAADNLRQLYFGNERIVVVQAAVDRESGTRKIFTLDAQNGPPWVGGLASFELKTILKHCDLVPGLETMIKQSTVNCVTFDKVLDCLPGQHLDLLQVDTEGADGLILSLFPFDRLKPAIIHWEIKHLTKPEMEETLQMLRRHGYVFARSGGEDMLAVLRSVD